MERRKFIGAGVLVAGLGALPNTLAASTPDVVKLPRRARYVLSESGQLARDAHYVQGMLVLSQSATHYEEAINEIRRRLNYRSELNYGSTCKYKFDFAKAVIAYFIASDLRYVGVSFDKQAFLNSTRGVNSGFNRRKQRELLQRKLLEGSTEEKIRSNSVILTKPWAAFGPTAAFRKAFKKNVGVKFEPVPGYQSNLLQLADLLTGWLRNEFVQKTTNHRKYLFNRWLQQQLQVDVRRTSTDPAAKVRLL